MVFGMWYLAQWYLSQENPNYSFLLPFAQYNLQCPGYYLPVLQGKWVYPHSNSTCRIWNKIISYSAITRDPHRGGWVVGRASGGIFLALWQKEMYLLPSLLLVGDFCQNRVFSLNIRPSVTYRQRPFCKIPNVFLNCVPKFMSDILCGCGMSRKDTSFFVIGWSLLRPQDEWRLSWVISVTEQAFN